MGGNQHWPADRVERREIDTLFPYEKNPRTHSEAQIEQIANSIAAFGFAMPVLIDEDGVIIAGHARVLAARKLKLTAVPTMTAKGWTDDEKRAYLLADNKLSLNADWDDKLLRLELGELKLQDFNLSLTGFSDLELGRLLAPEVAGLTDPDHVPDPPPVGRAQAGDLWRLGNHALLCGDATDAALVGILPPASLCFTSPPYLQQRDYSAAVTDWEGMMCRAFEAAPLTPDAQVLVNLGLVHRDGGWLPYWDGWIAWMRGAGWRSFGWYVWDQGFGLPGDWNGRLAPSHEFIFHFNRVAERARKSVGKKPASIIEHAANNPKHFILRDRGDKHHPIDTPAAMANTHKIADSVIRITRQMGAVAPGEDHPAVFPVALARAVIEAFSDPGDLTLDPFCGSGTTIIAAEITGRCCAAVELNPAYVDLAIRRWEEFTGQVAVCEREMEVASG